MARANRRTGADGNRTSAARRPSAADAIAAGAFESEPLRATVEAAFRTDEIIAEAVKSKLKTRTVAADAIRKRADVAFKDFSPSSYAEEERARKTYLAPGDKLATVLEDIATTAAKKLKVADGTLALRFEDGGALDELMKRRRGEDSNARTIKFADLLESSPQRLEAAPTPLSWPTCDAADEAERRLTDIESGAYGADAATPPSTNGDGAPGSDGAVAAGALVKTTVNNLMGELRPPEARFAVDPPKRADGTTIAEHVAGFELRDGPSDVTSYHDFNSLQIAFPHVWTEVFDGELERLGKEIYREYVRLNEFAGLDDGKDRPISTVADLSRLIGDIQELSLLTQAELPGGGATKPGGGGANGTAPAGASDQLGGVVESVLTGDFIENDALRWFLNPAGAAVGFLSDLFAGKQQANWESFEPGRTLPGGIDIITATFEQNAVAAGEVEIVITNSAAAPTWKGIDFYEIDSTGRPVNLFKIANDPRDRGVWNAQSYNRLPLYTQQVTNGVLEFGKEIMFGAHKAHYFLVGLDEKLKDRTRVTFKWERDK
jgi:hypothetical protein